MDEFVVRCAAMDGFLTPNDSYFPINNTLYGCKNWRLAKGFSHTIQPEAPERNAAEENS
jgi:hypothetical protein